MSEFFYRELTLPADQVGPMHVMQHLDEVLVQAGWERLGQNPASLLNPKSYVPAGSYLPSVNALKPLALYLQNEASGTVVKDGVNGYDLLLTGTTSLKQAGLVVDATGSLQYQNALARGQNTSLNMETGIGVEASWDGTTWLAVQNGGSLPGINPGESLVGKQLRLRENLYWYANNASAKLTKLELRLNDTTSALEQFTYAEQDQASFETGVLTNVAFQNGGLVRTDAIPPKFKWYSGYGMYYWIFGRLPMNRAEFDRFFNPQESYVANQGGERAGTWAPWRELWWSSNGVVNWNKPDFLPDDYLSFQLELSFYAPETGTYSFALDFDGHAQFTVNGQYLIEHYATSSTTTAKAFAMTGLDPNTIPSALRANVALTKGWNQMRVRLVDYFGDDGLVVAWKKPSDANFSFMPKDAFYLGMAPAPLSALSTYLVNYDTPASGMFSESGAQTGYRNTGTQSYWSYVDSTNALRFKNAKLGFVPERPVEVVVPMKFSKNSNWTGTYGLKVAGVDTGLRWSTTNTELQSDLTRISGEYAFRWKYVLAPLNDLAGFMRFQLPASLFPDSTSQVELEVFVDKTLPYANRPWMMLTDYKNWTLPVEAAKGNILLHSSMQPGMGGSAAHRVTPALDLSAAKTLRDSIVRWAPYEVSAPPTGLTVETWAAFLGTPFVSNDWHQLVMKGEHNQNGAFGILVHTNVLSALPGEVRLYLPDATYISASMRLLTGVPYHFVGTVTDTKAELWVDGRLVASRATGVSAVGTKLGQSDLHLGSSPVHGFRFNGKQSHTALYPFAFTPDQIRQHYVNGYPDERRTFGSNYLDVNGLWDITPELTYGPFVYKHAPSGKILWLKAGIEWYYASRAHESCLHLAFGLLNEWTGTQLPNHTWKVGVTALHNNFMNQEARWVMGADQNGFYLYSDSGDNRGGFTLETTREDHWLVQQLGYSNNNFSNTNSGLPYSPVDIVNGFPASGFTNIADMMTNNAWQGLGVAAGLSRCVNGVWEHRTVPGYVLMSVGGANSGERIQPTTHLLRGPYWVWPQYNLTFLSKLALRFDWHVENYDVTFQGGTYRRLFRNSPLIYQNLFHLRVQ